MGSQLTRIREELEELTLEELNNVYKILTVHFKKRYWNIQTFDLEGMISGAIVKLLNGDRTSGDSGLVETLRGVIRSDVSHEFEKRKRQSKAEELWSQVLTPPRKRFANLEHDRQQVWQRLRELVSGDAVLLGMVELLETDGNVPMKEMAFELGIPIGDMRLAKKRLDRYRAKLRREWLDG